MAEDTPHPSRLERFKKTFPNDRERVKALHRLVTSIRDSEPDKTGQRTRYRPLSFAEMRRVLKNREQNGDAEVERRMREQEASLNEWISYLDEEYADKKYTFIIHKILAPQVLGARDSIGDQPFERRTPETYAPYPRLNREALGNVMTSLVAISEGRQEGEANFIRRYEAELHRVEKIAREKVGKKFEGIPSTWKTYAGQKGARELEKDLADKGTGWCIAGFESGYHTYLMHRNSLIHVCFRGEKDAGVAIYTVDGRISQIRGSAPGQHMDGDAAKRAKAYIRKHLSEGNDLADLDQKFDDVLMLTEIIDGAIERAHRGGNVPRLLRFLYEIDRPIRFFGYGRDQRVDALRKRRNTIKDAGIIFEGLIAETADEITSETKAFIGPLSPEVSAGVWKRILEIEKERTKKGQADKIAVFTSFPEEHRTRRTIELQATKTTQQITQALESKKIVMSEYARDRVDQITEDDLKEIGAIQTVTVRVRDLFTDKELVERKDRLPTTDEIFDVKNDGERYKKLGLELCKAKDAAQILLDEADPEKTEKTLSNSQWKSVAMERFSDRDGDPHVLNVERDVGGALELSSRWAAPGSEWGLGNELVFRLRE